MIQTGSIRIPFCYAAGAAASRFLTALRNREQILGSHCAACTRVLIPLRSFCPSCGQNGLQDVEVGPEGIVVSWTERPEGPSFVLVRLDGADTPFVHHLLGSVRQGSRVRCRFAPERRGSVLDLIGFEPIDDGNAA